jgi:DNA-binding response OmpR family regulator
MGESILNHKKVLVVDDEPDILTVVKEEIQDLCPDTEIDTAGGYARAADLLNAKEYDLVILDIMGVRGFDLLPIAVGRKFKVVMLTAHDISPEALHKTHDLGGMAYLPKDELGELVPFLEDVLKHEYRSGWRLLLQKLDAYFTEEFHSPDWKDKIPWYHHQTARSKK